MIIRFVEEYILFLIGHVTSREDVVNEFLALWVSISHPSHHRAVSMLDFVENT